VRRMRTTRKTSEEARTIGLEFGDRLCRGRLRHRSRPDRLLALLFAVEGHVGARESVRRENDLLALGGGDAQGLRVTQAEAYGADLNRRAARF
jgi:hypothetical protein